MYILVYENNQIMMFGNDPLENIPDSINIDNQYIKYIISIDYIDKFEEYKKDKMLIEAAGGMILNQQNDLLMIFRRGFWDMPKGKVDFGETMEECAVREVMEETGLTHIKLIQKLQTTYHTYTLENKIVLKPSHRYLMNFDGDEIPIPQTEEDITEIKWMNKSEIEHILHSMYPSIREVVLKYYLD